MFLAGPALPDGFAFLAGGGAAAHTMAEVDWANTPLGPVAGWPKSLKAVASMLVRSPAAMVLLWGPEGILLYNDGYAVIAGDRHPAAMGAKVHEAWPEVADFNGHVMQVVHAGGTMTYKDQPLTLHRNGYAEQTWFTLDYSGVCDDDDQVAGVLAVVQETTDKVKAEQWQQGESERMRQMFEQAPGFMALLRGPEHVFELVNRAYLQLVGHRNIVGLPVRQALPDIDGQGYYELLDQVFTSGETFTGTALPVTLQHTPGGATEQRYVDLVYQALRNPAGQVFGIFVQGSDVTERLAAGQALAESEARLRRAQEAGRVGVFTVDMGRNTISGSREFFRIFGFEEREGMAAEAFENLVLKEDEALRSAAATRGTPAVPLDVEYRIHRASDGALRWIARKAEYEHDASGKPVRMLGVVQDVTDRKLAQLALEVETRRDRNRIWALSRELMLVCDYAGRIMAVNPAAERLLGWTEGDMVGATLLDFVHPDDAPGTTLELAKLADGTATAAFENRYRAKDGEYRLLNWAAVPDGGVIHGIARDVTRERKAEDALRQAQKMEALGQLTGGIAHDFNNILQGILGSITAVQRLIAQNRAGEVDRFIANAINSSKKAAALTHRLLAFSRRQPLEPRTVQVNPLVASMEELLQRTLGERIHLRLALASGLWLTKCDPNQLENAILNLAINSRDAMPEGGTLMIETRNAVMDGVLSTAKDDVQPGRYVCVAVTDTGAGMDADTLAKAFDPFFTTKPLGQGTGLGLSMIYGFARQSEGYAKIYSEPGTGTTVKLYLPLQQDAAHPDDPEAEHPGQAHPLGVGTVAVVEDEAVVRELVVGLLGDLGYLVLQAHDGPSGLTLLQSHPEVNLLVTDVGLPGMNGRQLADAARALRPGLRVLFMTGYAENAVFASGMLDTGMSMITKPFAMDQMAARVREMLQA